MPTWHEVKQADSSTVALHLSKAHNFDEFSDLLVSTLKILKKYDRLTDRVGADEQTFLDELKVVRVRMERVSLAEQPAPSSSTTESRTRPPPPTGSSAQSLGIRPPPPKKSSSLNTAMSPSREAPAPPLPARPVRMPGVRSRAMSAPTENQQNQAKVPVSIPPSEEVNFPSVR